MFDLSIVLPTRNRADQLLKALIGIERNTQCGYEVVVVDGASSDATNDVLMLASSIMGKRLRVIREGTALGFAAACNKGVAIARGRYVAILHDDSHPSEGALNRAVRQLDEMEDDLAIVSLFSKAESRMAVAQGRVIHGETYGVGHVRGTLVAEYPVAARRIFESQLFDASFQTSAALIEWSFNAWDFGCRIVPAIDSVLDEHFKDTSDSEIDGVEKARVLASWNLPVATTTYDVRRPCQLRGRNQNKLAA